MVWLSSEPLPGIAACVDDSIVGLEHAIAELVTSQIGPDVLDWIELGTVGRQVQQGDVVGHAQLVAGLVPASTVDGEHSVRPGRDTCADLIEVQAHHLGVGKRQHQPSSGATARADRTEDVGPRIALIAGCRGSRAALGPDPGQGSLLTDPGLVLPPEFERLAAGVLWQRLVYEGGEVALKDACAAAS